MHPSIWMPLYVWKPPICLDVPHTFGCHNTFSSIQTYRGGIQTYEGHLNIQEGFQTCGGIQPYRGVSKHRGIQTYIGYPNIWGEANMGVSKHTGGHPNIWGASKHTGGVQTYGASKHIGGHPNIWGHSNICGGASKHMVASKHTGAWKHMEVSKCMGAYGHPLVWQSMLSLCCVCTEGIQTYEGTQYFLYNPELYLPAYISAIFFF